MVMISQMDNGFTEQIVRVRFSSGVAGISGTLAGGLSVGARIAGSRTLTAAEQAEIQAISNQYKTTIDVVGSRAAGQGRKH